MENSNINEIKIHGLQRSGTNYVSDLINRNIKNSKVLVNIGGWKHGPYCAPWVLGREVNVVIVVKDPYAWLKSMYDWWKNTDIGPDLNQIDFSTFIRNKAIFEEAAGNPCLYRASNPVQYWNNMNFHWMSIMMNDKKKCLIPYEASYKVPDKIVKIIAQTFDLETNDEIVSLKKEFLPSSETQQISETDWNKANYFSTKEYLSSFSEDDLEFVKKELDKDITQYFGY